MLIGTARFYVQGYAASGGGASRMPMLLRRRLGPLGRLAIEAAYAAGVSPDQHYIFCSRHGEFSRLLNLLDAAAAGEPLSPAQFSVSVHNALAGLLSIATGAKAGHTAIAAGADSFAYGLIEAACLLAASPETPVMLVYYDEALPPPYDRLDDGADDAGPLALALALRASAPGTPLRIRFYRQDRPEPVPSLAVARAFSEYLAGGSALRAASGAQIHLEWSDAPV